MMSDNNCCCSAPDSSCYTPDVEHKPDIKVTTSKLTSTDILGAWKARLGIGRMVYIVDPGLYAIGKPDNNSPVFVSANYKLSFDTLRKNLDGLDCWVLVLDTKGINVWCAAGKGTFGTDELLHRIEASELSSYVSHKRLILPQLGATGVSAHKVKQHSGYDIKHGPVRASDIKEYVKSGYSATKEMRTVQFNMWDRLVLTPMELIPAVKYALPILGVMFAANQIAPKPFDKTDYTSLALSVFTGSVLTPVLLPYIPGRAFSLKGWLLGFGVTAKLLGLTGKLRKGNLLLSAGHLLLFPAISSFLAMNFTGASTYTSPSGVNKEMKKALPFIIGAAAAGTALTLGVHLFGRKAK